MKTFCRRCRQIAEGDTKLELCYDCSKTLSYSPLGKANRHGGKRRKTNATYTRN